MKAATKNIFGGIGFLIAIGGVVFSILWYIWLTVFVGTHPDAALTDSTHFFFFLEICALLTGAFGWKSKFGKASVLVSIVSIIAAVLFWLYILSSISNAFY